MRRAAIANSFGAEVHTDVYGPCEPLSLGGRKFFVTFTDDHTRYTRLEILRTMDQAFDAYKAFVAWVQTRHGVHVKRLRCDRGGKLPAGHELTKYLREQGTERRLTMVDAPQHNGLAVLLNHWLYGRIRAMLHQANLPKTLWAEAAHFTVWLKNRMSTQIPGYITPYERLYGEKPDLGSVPEWGQYVWVNNPARSDSEFPMDSQATEARWVGFDANNIHAHRVYWPGRNCVTVEQNVSFASAAY